MILNARLAVGAIVLAQVLSAGLLAKAAPPEIAQANLPTDLHQGMRLDAFMTHVAIPVGQYVGFEVRVENFNNANGYFWIIWPEADFHFDVRDADGKFVTLTSEGARLQDGHGGGGSSIGPMSVPVDQALHYYFNLSTLFELKKAGHYTVKVKLQIENGSIMDSRWSEHSKGFKDGIPETLESKAVSFTIVNSDGAPATRESDETQIAHFKFEPIELSPAATQPDAKK